MVTLEILNQLEHCHTLILNNRKAIIEFINEFVNLTEDPRILSVIEFVNKFYTEYQEVSRIEYIHSIKKKIINESFNETDWNPKTIDNGFGTSIQLLGFILLCSLPYSIENKLKTANASIFLIEKMENVINTFIYLQAANEKFNFFKNLKNLDNSLNLKLEPLQYFDEKIKKSINTTKYILFTFKEQIKSGNNITCGDIYETLNKEFFPELYNSNVIQFPKK